MSKDQWSLIKRVYRGNIDAADFLDGYRNTDVAIVKHFSYSGTRWAMSQPQKQLFIEELKSSKYNLAVHRMNKGM